jgi:putative membrane protein
MPHFVPSLLVALVALEHVYILLLEMFLWTTPRGRRTFGTTEEFARATRALAANQGLYNGFLAAGLVWSLLPGAEAMARPLQFFFLGCVLTAAVFGAATSKRSILVVQGGPAALALLGLLLSG